MTKPIEEKVRPKCKHCGKSSLADSTIKREMRRLRKIIDERNANDLARERRTGATHPADAITMEAYGMETALQWTLGGCDWTPSGMLPE